MDQQFNLESSSSPKSTKEASSLEDLPDNYLTNVTKRSEAVLEAIPQDNALESELKVQNFLQMIEKKVHLQLMREQFALDSEETSAMDSDEEYVTKLLSDHSNELEKDELAMDLIQLEDPHQLDSEEDVTPRASLQELNEQPAKDKLELDSDLIPKHITWELEMVNDLPEDAQIQRETASQTDQKPLKMDEDKQTKLQPDSAVQSEFVAKLLIDLSLPTTDFCETLPTSNAELKQSELEESTSCTSYKSDGLTPSQHQLFCMPLNESFSLQPLIDTNAVVNVQWLEDQESNFNRKILSLVLSGDSFDIKVYIGVYRFHCQLGILQLYSSRIVPNPKQTPYRVRLPEDQVTPDAFNAIYQWMTHDKPMKLKKYGKRSLIEFCKAVRYLNIAELNDSVCSVMENIKNEAKAFTMLLDFTQLGMMDFQVLFLSRISRFFLTLAASLEFMEMSLSYVCQLLNSNSLGVNSEIEVFYAAVRWLSHKWPLRQPNVQNVISCVRFGLIPPMFLRFLQVPQTTQVMDCINQSCFVNDLINKAFVFASAELYCLEPKHHLIRQLPHYVATEPRKWLFDPKCAYHHTFACNLRQFFTYEQFLEYLETLQHSKPNEWEELQYLTETMRCCPR